MKRTQGRNGRAGADRKCPVIARISSHTLVINMMTAGRIAAGTAVLAARGMKKPFLLLIVLKKSGRVRQMNIAVSRQRKRKNNGD